MPGSVVLLHAPKAAPASWGDLPEMLRSYGLAVIAPDVPGETCVHYVARVSLIIAAAGPPVPLVLAAHGAAGPLLPAIALAQRAAHRPVGGYVFVDADLPRVLRSHDHGGPGDQVPVPPDWPEAPCGYLRTHAGRRAAGRTEEPRAPGEAEGSQAEESNASSGRDRAVREAHLRGWPVMEHKPPTTVAQALSELIAAL